MVPLNATDLFLFCLTKVSEIIVKNCIFRSVLHVGVAAVAKTGKPLKQRSNLTKSPPLSLLSRIIVLQCHSLTTFDFSEKY